YKFHFENKDGITADTNDMMTLQMAYRTKDSLLFSTAQSGQPAKLPLLVSDHPGDIYEGLAMLKVGDSATFIVSADSFFMRTLRMEQLPEYIKPGSMMYFDIKVLEILSMEEIEREKKAQVEALKLKEPELLYNYLQEKSIKTEPLTSGLYYIQRVAGSGRKAIAGDRMKTHFVISLIDGKQLFSSYDRGEPFEIEIGSQFDNAGLTEALALMRKGEKATLIIPSALAFGEEGRGEFVPPYSTMIYEVEAVEIKTKEEYEKEQKNKEQQMKQAEDQAKVSEKQNITKYLKDNGIQATPTANGLYYIEKVKGTGIMAEPGKKVNVHYTGTLLNGTKFDSSVDRGTPFEFTLGQGQVIRGWDEGIALMNVGGKALLIIPYELAYGSRAMGENLPAYSTLLFEVELLGVE
ncbi:MAG: FKBP-type peptidyl-prolyl cis-trans isomerase, partial [Bacteroidales bacterium]|nr:FKBP-type peptidyl-prolyl cis-trans isomerase [Bacteroidales bacterium]